MTVAVRAFDHRYIPMDEHAGYASNTVSQLTDPLEHLKHGGSPTVRESQPSLRAAVWNTQGAPGITENTTAAAAQARGAANSRASSVKSSLGGGEGLIGTAGL